MEERKKKIRDVLCTKAKEYATFENRFHNFDAAARLLNCTPKAALEGMLVKHWVSVMDLIDTPPPVFDELISEKVGDAINYVILNEGLRLRDTYAFENVVEASIALVRPYVGIRGFTKGDMDQLWTVGLSSVIVIPYLATLEQILYRRNEKQPKYRPYTASELFDFFTTQERINHRATTTLCRMSNFQMNPEEKSVVFIQGVYYSPEELLRNFVRSDGSPCGVKVVNNGH